MTIEIDNNSGFCFGVINAIKTAEEWLQKEGTLFCLGDIVHNSKEMQRLIAMGLKVISHEEFQRLQNTKVLIRAHGEPPETYQTARANGIEIIDATCKVVLNLQKTIKQQFENQAHGTQILIFGKQGHAEVVGLLGQTRGQGIVLSSLDDVGRIDFDRPAHLFSQTTQDTDQYQQLIAAITQGYESRHHAELFTYSNTICHSVVNRAHQIEDFAKRFDKIIFVSGEKSSNGLYLYEICKKSNRNSYFITSLEQISSIDFHAQEAIGICGATSTPMWLMEEAAETISTLNHNITK